MTSNFRLGRRVPQNPPPVPKKPSIQERQRRYEQRAAMEGQQPQKFLPPPAPSAPPPPIGYNDADRFYVASPVPSDSSLELDQELEIYPQRLGSRPANEAQTSAWLSRKLNKMDTSGGDRQQQKAPTRAPMNAQTDTKELSNDEENRRRRLEEQVGDLKAENRVKSRELKTNKYIENEMNRKLKTADDAYLLRHTVKDKDRVIANQDKIIGELTAENAKLAEDLTERDRQVFELQSEVDNLDRVILAKKALRETERLDALGEDLDRTRDELASAAFEIETAKNELKTAQGMINRKDREIKSKGEQIDQLTKQLALAETKIAALENEKSVADNHSKAANREARLLKEQKDRLVDFKERCHNLEEENAYMADAIRTLETKVLQLESIKHDKEVLDDLVQDFKAALKDKNQIAKDRRNLIIETQQLKELLREKTVDEEALQKELEKLKDVLNELEKENNFYRDLEVDFRRVKKKYEDVEKERFKNELILAKLRPRVERLQNRCKEKDDLIRRLANEVRAGGDRLPRDLLQEADRNQNNSVNDYIDMNDYLGDDEPLSAQVRRSRDRRPYSSNQRYEPAAAYEPMKGVRNRSQSPTRPYDQVRATPHQQDRYRFSQQQPEQHYPSKEMRAHQQPSRSEPQSDNMSPSRYNDQRPTRQDPAAFRVPPPTAWDIPHHEAAAARSNAGPGPSDAVHEETIQPRKREEDESRNRHSGYDPMRLPSRDDPERYAREEPVRQHPRLAEQANPQLKHEPLSGGYEPQTQHDQLPDHSGHRPDLVRTDTYPVLDEPHGGPAPSTLAREPIHEAARSLIEPQQQQSHHTEQHHQPEQQQHHQPEQQQQPPQQPHQQHPPQQPQQPHQQPQHQPQQTLEPPANVRARMVPESDSLLVEWDTPALDELDRNNGVVVSGYNVFVNGVEQQPVVSSRVTRSLLPRSAFGAAEIDSLRISVQTYNYDGDISDKAIAAHATPQPVTDSQQPQPQQHRPTSPLTVQVDRPIDQQHLDPKHPEHPGQYLEHSPRGRPPMEDRFRTRDNSPVGPAGRLGPPPQPFVRRALYDYQPSQHSPSAFPPFELELRKGDEVQTFGPVRPDGMYNAEVNGKRGLVPAQYLLLTQ